MKATVALVSTLLLMTACTLTPKHANYPGLPAAPENARIPASQAPPPGPRCFMYGQGGSKISKGERFSTSQVIHSYPIFQKTASTKTPADELQDTFKKLSELQTAGTCPKAAEPNNANCWIRWTMFFNQWSASITDSDGIRVVASSADKSVAEGIANRLKEIGQCEQVYID